MQKITIIAILFGFMISKTAYCAQSATVKAQKAILFSDPKAQNPIGHLRKGKRIRVGEVPKTKRKMLPIVVSGGRVLYIQKKDIELEFKKSK